MPFAQMRQTIVALTLAAIANIAWGQEQAEWQDLAIAGVDAYNRGDFTEAVQQFELCLSLARALEEGDQRLINSHVNLALAYEALERGSEAEKLYLAAIRLQEQVFGTADPALAVMLSRLAGLYSGRGEWGQAEPLLRRALAVREDAAGPEHPYTALGMEELGNLLLAQGRNREAVVQYERAVAVRTAVFGPGHRSLARVLTRVGSAYRALGRLAESEDALLRSLSIWQDGTPAPPEEVLGTLEELVDLLVGAERFAEAITYGAQIAEMKLAQLGATNPAVADELDRYAGLLRRAGRLDEAAEQESLAAALRAD